ncbi:MAG: hypothetical protein AAGJ46_01755 [Planctomycetota bacterium]
MLRLILRFAAVLARPSVILLVVALSLAGRADAANQFWQPVGLGDWYASTGSAGESSNWDNGLGEMFIPTAEFDEIGTINNGGGAFVDIMPSGVGAEPNPGGVLLGEGAADSGSLEVRSGGSLTAVPWSSDGSNGGIVIGASGLGVASVARGGLLAGQTLSVGGAQGSSLTLGAGASGMASVQIVGNATLNRTTRVIGPDVDFLAGGNVVLGGQSTLIAEINSASSHSPIGASGVAQVGGTLRVEFDGVTPQPGDSWTLLSAGSINGSFASLDLSAAPEIPGGGGYRVTTSSGGLGEIVELTISQLLTLRVNWDDGQVFIENQGSAPVDIDGYSVLSGLGSLDSSPAAWTSFADAPIVGWEEASSSSNSLNELRQSGSTTLGGDFSQSLGSVFAPVIPAFGDSPEDLVFEYREADGTIVQGLVEYEGAAVVNNVRLIVDPISGDAQLKNDSPYSVTVDGYSVLSDAGALITGAFDGLGLVGWESAAPSANALSELLQAGSLTLSPGQAFNLGAIYDDTGSSRDLAVEFNTPDGPLMGVVTYGAIPVGVPGDFNGDGAVDAADYTVWRDGLGTIYTLGDYVTWKNNFGSAASAASASAAAVPEPSGLVLVLMMTAAPRPRRRL